jgi:ribulose kinase
MNDNTENTRKTPEYTLRAIINYRHRNKEKVKLWNAIYRATQVEKRRDDEYKAKVRAYNQMYHQRKKQEREQAKLLQSLD